MIKTLRPINYLLTLHGRNYCNYALPLAQKKYASKPSVRNVPKPPKDLKCYEEIEGFQESVFREHSAEQGLGPIAAVDESAKTGPYKNPEYYSYHHMSFYDFTVSNECHQQPQPDAYKGIHNRFEIVRKSCYQVASKKHRPSDRDQMPPPNCPPAKDEKSGPGGNCGNKEILDGKLKSHPTKGGDQKSPSGGGTGPKCGKS
ncbi:uncharacterized protein LOC129756933 [Uranotaenia lowii]|uniref:uncharacterized protein LOC129756933 n=1 Tax=Uranotaenia lowii TaxID=190385 RepID=UPI002478E16B|nr:uncharacterized protein LOC129756933 [Uranotaenia lowii]